jgi:hypothetical protein
MLRYETVKRFSIALLLSAAQVASADAEFLRTRSAGVYQHTSGTTKVIVGAKDAVQGIFVLSGPSVAPSEFSAESELSPTTSHLFISFDPTAQPPRYTEILIKEKRYRIRGNLKIRIGAHTTVSIDNNNPYLTVVEAGRIPEEADDILGFAGTNEVVRGSGAVAAVLAANQLDDSGGKGIPLFEVANNELTLNGSSVTDGEIGTAVALTHECLHASSIVMTDEELLRIEEERNAERAMRLFQEIVEGSQGRGRLARYLILKGDSSAVVLLDVVSKGVNVMRAQTPSSIRQKVCVLSKLQVKR